MTRIVDWKGPYNVKQGNLFELVIGSAVDISIAGIDANGRPWVGPGVTAEQIVRNLARTQGYVDGNTFLITDDVPGIGTEHRHLARIEYDGTVKIWPNVTSEDILLVVCKQTYRQAGISQDSDGKITDNLPLDQRWRRWRYTGPYAIGQSIRCPQCSKLWQQADAATTVPPVTAQCPECDPVPKPGRLIQGAR